MRRLLCLLFVLALPGLVSAQTATPGQSLAWDFPTASAELVTRFEVNYDGTGYVSVGLVPHPTTANQFYAPIPALVTGQHTVLVRACNAAGCGPDSALFTFPMVAGAPSAVPSGSVTIIPTPAP